MVRRSSTVTFERIAHIQDQLELVAGDLLDEVSLINILRDHRPTEVYNLAAQSFVQTSCSQPVLTGETTALGVTRLLDAIRLVDPEIRFYQASSSEMFGKVREVPQAETTPLYPRSPYGVAKVYGHWITVNYRESYGLHASSGILFNHESPRRGLEFVTRKITNGVARIAHGLDDKLAPRQPRRPARLGFRRPTTCGPCGSCSSRTSPTTTSSRPARPTRCASCAAWPSQRSDLDWEQHVVIDEKFLRPAEVDLLVGDPSKAHEVLGWEPEVDFPGLVAMMVEADMDLVRRTLREGRAPALSSPAAISADPLGVLAAFGAGILSFLSPCVLPLVPGYLSMVSGLSAAELSAGPAGGASGSGTTTATTPRPPPPRR